MSQQNILKRLRNIALDREKLSNYYSFKLKTRDDYIRELAEEMSEPTPFIELLKKIREKKASALEEYCRLRIQPKPFWIPQFIWERLLKRILVLEYFQKENK